MRKILFISDVKFFFLLSFFLFLFSCSQTEMSRDQYISWMQNNAKNFMTNSVQGDWYYSLSYIPAEWLALQEIRVETNDDEMKQLIESYRPMQHYVLKISSKDTAGNDALASRYFPFEMQKDIFLVEHNDTLPCILFHFENTFSLTGEHTFNIGFENSGSASSKTLLFLPEGQKITSVEIKMDKAMLSNLPTLKTAKDAI